MVSQNAIVFFVFISLVNIFRMATAISCYQCLSTDHVNPFQCTEYMTDADITPQPCDDIYNAQYCVKHTGRFEGQTPIYRTPKFIIPAGYITNIKDAFLCGKVVILHVSPRGKTKIYVEPYSTNIKCSKCTLAVDCYQCSAALNIACADNLIHDGTLQPTACDSIYGASFCIKTTGIYQGGLGTKRFCSSLDLGTYCNYIQQPGDELEYRSCVYTCSTHGCNPAVRPAIAWPLALLALSLVLAAGWR